MRASKTLQPTKKLGQAKASSSSSLQLRVRVRLRHCHRHRQRIKLKPQKYATVWHIVAATTTGPNEPTSRQLRRLSRLSSRVLWPPRSADNMKLMPRCLLFAAFAWPEYAVYVCVYVARRVMKIYEPCNRCPVCMTAIRTCRSVDQRQITLAKQRQHHNRVTFRTCRCVCSVCEVCARSKVIIRNARFHVGAQQGRPDALSAFRPSHTRVHQKKREEKKNRIKLFSYFDVRLAEYIYTLR